MSSVKSQCQCETMTKDMHTVNTQPQTTQAVFIYIYFFLKRFQYGESTLWLIKVKLQTQKSRNVTCTSSPCSQPLDCTHPSICGTSLKPSPLSPELSKIHTEAWQLLLKKAMFFKNKRKPQKHFCEWLTLYNWRTWFSRKILVSVYSLSPKGSGYATHKA